jgi:excisionase family DNA binding protein
MNSNIDKLFTIEEVAKILRVSGRSVTRYIESGKLKASKIGVWRIKESDLHAFLEKTSNLKENKKYGKKN